MVQSLLLDCQHNYNSERKYQSQGFSNKLMFAQSGKTGDDDGETKYNTQNPKEILTTSPAIIMYKKVTML